VFDPAGDLSVIWDHSLLTKHPVEQADGPVVFDLVDYRWLEEAVYLASAKEHYSDRVGRDWMLEVRLMRFLRLLTGDRVSR